MVVVVVGVPVVSVAVEETVALVAVALEPGGAVELTLDPRCEPPQPASPSATATVSADAGRKAVRTAGLRPRHTTNGDAT